MEHENSSIAWHPAFIEAIQLELVEYKDYLEFHSELQLSSEPLKIDCVIIKKVKDVIIRKNIAAIFREANLIEYKSPLDYVSINDFYKVYAYACLYTSFKKVPITSLTLTFVESHYPEKLIEHFKEIRGYTVEENSPGIYTVIGDILPIQLIDNRQLSAEENLWLRDLDNQLGSFETERITKEIFKLGKGVRINAYFNVITRANRKIFREVFGMKEVFEVVEELLEETGWTAKLEAKFEARGEARGEERKAINIAQNMINLGLPLETIISATRLESEKVKALYEQAE